jgi:hypothetical protein
MSYFKKLDDLGFMVICRRNPLGTTTMTAVRESDYELESDCLYNAAMDVECYDIGALIEILPEWRVVDFAGDDAALGAQLLYEKLTYTGAYVGYDERRSTIYMIGHQHRPESERFQAVEDAPAPPPELVENLNLQQP